MKGLLLILMLLPITMLGQTTVSATALIEYYYPADSFGQKSDVPLADRKFRSLMILDYTDAVKYQDWHYIRRIARLLTWMGERDK